MKVLILGGTGLISTAITRQLVSRDDMQVTLFNRGQRPPRFPADRVTYIHGDRHEYTHFEAQMTAAGDFDCVIDMICFTPDEAASTVRAFRGRTNQLIFTSTVDVYRKPASRYPITEDEARRGNNSYGSNKILCEDIFFEADSAGDFKTTIIRPAYSYGEGGKIVDTFGWGTSFIHRLREGKPLIVHGDGSSFWVACHVDDVARTYVEAISNPVTYGRAYHVTGEEWLTWDRYYQILAEALNIPAPKLAHIPTDLLAEMAPEHSGAVVTNFFGNNIFDNTAARRDLNFRYTISWREGAQRTVAWLDENGQIDTEDAFQDRIILAWEAARQVAIQRML